MGLGCLRSPGNIMDGASGVLPLSSTSDGPWDPPALGDGPLLLQSPCAASNFLEFTSPLDTLHQQVVEQQQVVEGSTTPFHPQRLSSPPSPPPGDEPALLLRSASRVNSTSKHGDGSGITYHQVDGTTSRLPRLNAESAPCVANSHTAPHDNRYLKCEDKSLSPTPTSVTPPLLQSSADNHSTPLIKGMDNGGHPQTPSADQCLSETTGLAQRLATATVRVNSTSKH